MTIRLPYTLQEGTVAYATKVMADLNAILSALNNLSADGFSTQDITGMIADLADAINTKVTANEDNASEIVFTDGDTLQEKFTNGDLNGTDGVAVQLDGCVAFDVDDDGHLWVGTNSGSNPYSLVGGHVIYTVPSPTGADYVTYDLGNVKGDTGEVTTAAMTAAIAAAVSDIGTAASAVAYVLDWGAVVAGQNVIDCSGVTASNFIFVSPALSATETERDEFRNAQIYPVSQTTDSFVIGYDGTVPTADIPLQVIILNV